MLGQGRIFSGDVVVSCESTDLRKRLDGFVPESKRATLHQGGEPRHGQLDVDLGAVKQFVDGDVFRDLVIREEPSGSAPQSFRRGLLRLGQLLEFGLSGMCPGRARFAPASSARSSSPGVDQGALGVMCPSSALASDPHARGLSLGEDVVPVDVLLIEREALGQAREDRAVVVAPDLPGSGCAEGVDGRATAAQSVPRARATVRILSTAV